MRKIVYRNYGLPEVLQQAEALRPVPKDDEILIRTHATTVTSADWRCRSLSMPPGFGFLARPMLGITKPRQQILGSELAGIVEEVGKNVSRFKIGDSVFAFTGASLGCYVDFKCIPENANVVLMPSNLNYHEAAALSFGGTTALDFFRKGRLKEGDRVVINGASGGVGTAAVQLAKNSGAIVTGVCSGANTTLVKSIGADHVIDYTKVNIAEINDTFDIIMDTVGTLPYSRCSHLLNENGRFLMVLGGLSDMLQIPWVSITSRKKIIAGPAAELLGDLQSLAKLAEDNKFKPVVDRVFPVDQIVEAHSYVDTGRKKGNVVINWRDC